LADEAELLGSTDSPWYLFELTGPLKTDRFFRCSEEQDHHPKRASTHGSLVPEMCAGGNILALAANRLLCPPAFVVQLGADQYHGPPGRAGSSHDVRHTRHNASLRMRNDFYVDQLRL
jgi:hypothetical protein